MIVVQFNIQFIIFIYSNTLDAEVIHIYSMPIVNVVEAHDIMITMS